MGTYNFSILLTKLWLANGINIPKIEEMDRGIEQVEYMDQSLNKIIIKQKKEMDRGMDVSIVDHKKEVDRQIDDLIALIAEKGENKLDMSEDVVRRMEDLIANHVEQEMDHGMDALIADHKKELDRQMEDLIKEMGRQMQDLNAQKREKNWICLKKYP